MENLTQKGEPTLTIPPNAYVICVNFNCKTPMSKAKYLIKRIGKVGVPIVVMNEIFGDRKEVLEVIDQQVLATGFFLHSSPFLIGLPTSSVVQRRVKAYTLQVVSVGPYHQGEKSLCAMEEQKLRGPKKWGKTEGLTRYPGPAQQSCNLNPFLELVFQ
ncbi:Protein of unknown function DUF247, plant [Dillenia turbinata]|uniref:Uncharacterized protein n=1 Tax=Dillenia turbinata TaxID=194707 RepID=A0AAN8V677_9MAGN